MSIAMVRCCATTPWGNVELVLEKAEGFGISSDFKPVVFVLVAWLTTWKVWDRQWLQGALGDPLSGCQGNQPQRVELQIQPSGAPGLKS